MCPIANARGTEEPGRQPEHCRGRGGVERSAGRVTTNEAGYYVISSLPPAFYTVTAEAPGFKRFEKTQNKLDPNISTTVDVAMQVGAASEVVNVVAEAQSLQSETATLGKLITTSEVKNIPLNGRNPLFLALLKPGVSGGALAQFSFGLSTGGLNINGSRTQDNVITFDARRCCAYAIERNQHWRRRR